MRGALWGMIRVLRAHVEAQASTSGMELWGSRQATFDWLLFVQPFGGLVA